MDSQLVAIASSSSLVPIVISSLISIFGIISATLKIRSDLLKESSNQNNKNIAVLRELYDLRIKALKEEKEELKEEILTMEERLEKRQDREIRAIKETYDNELKHLRQKVEELRDEVRTGNSQLIALLSKIVNH